MGWIVVVVLVLIVIAVGVSRGWSRGGEKLADRNRCAYCRTRLKVSGDKRGYADYCKKCGRQQPWAEGPRTTTT